MRKFILFASILTILAIQGCGPNIKSEADQKTKKDSLDLQEGKSEGQVPEEIIK